MVRAYNAICEITILIKCSIVLKRNWVYHAKIRADPALRIDSAKEKAVVRPNAGGLQRTEAGRTEGGCLQGEREGEREHRADHFWEIAQIGYRKTFMPSLLLRQGRRLTTVKTVRVPCYAGYHQIEIVTWQVILINKVGTCMSMYVLVHINVLMY